MSRKTRKLIWSVPLVAVLAVAGALAIFVALSPNQASAQDQMVMVPGPVTDLEAEVKSRSSIELDWEAPSADSGGTPTGYRIDHSDDNREWSLLKDDTGSTATRYLIDDGVKANTERYYRVFAINEAGTGPVSVDPVTAYASVPTDFPPKAPGRPALTLTLDAKDPYGKINITWTEPENNGSDIVSYEIVEMIDADSVGTTARVECADNLQVTEPDGQGGTNNLYRLKTDPEDVGADERHCLLIPAQDADEDRMAMHAGLTGGESHYYRVTATNAGTPAEGAPSDTKGITTRTPTRPDSPTEPVAVPVNVSNTQTIYLYWLDSVSNGGHDLANYQIEVQARIRESGPDATDVNNNNPWGAWTERISLNDADGTYASSAVTVSADNGDGTDTDISVDVTPRGSTAAELNALGNAYNMSITVGGQAGEYKFWMKAKQSGDADRGLDLESSWVLFNQRTRAGLGFITIPVPEPQNTEVPLVPTLMADALDADEVKDQGIGLTWAPNVGVDFDHDDDVATPAVKRPDFDNPDYRIDVSENGIKWVRGQTRTIAVRNWKHEGLKSDDTRYYRLFPINHGRFGEAAIAGAQADKAVIASPDQVLNLRQTGSTTTSITMTWDAVSAAANYGLYSGTPGDNDELPTDWTSMDPPTTEATTFTDSKNLNPGDTRWYRVVALADDKSPVSGADGAEALGTADDAGEPGVPIGLVAQEAFDSSLTNSDDRGVLLLWDMPMDVGKDPHTSYTVEWKSDMETGDAWEVLVTDTTNLDNQTPKSTHYHHEMELGTDEQRAYRVKALSGSGAGMASNVSYYPPMAVTLNTAPMAVGTIDAVTVTAGQMSDAMDVSGYFSDTEGDTLAYSAMSDMEMYATVSVVGSMVTINGVAAGTATITVTATDAAGAYAMQIIMVTVEAADTTPMAPSGVMARIGQGPDQPVIVTWTDGVNAEAHGVILFTSDFGLTEHIDRGMNGTHTFENVVAGSYIAVVVVLDAEGGLVTDANGDYLYAGAESAVMVQP